MCPLTPPDAGSTLSRPDRFPCLVDAPRDARQRVAGKRVLAAGVGAVGRSMTDGMARLGVGGLDVVDPGVLAPENLATHPIGADELGLPKALAAGRRALEFAPQAEVRVAQGVAEALHLAAWFEPDLVLLASDHPAVEVEVGQRCLWAGRPLIHAAVHGDTLTAQVRVFGADPAGPCPACLFGAHERELVDGSRRFRCDGSGQPEAADTPPTAAPGFLCGLAAQLALTEALMFLLDLRPIEDRLIEHNGYTQRVVVSPLERRADCSCEHVRFADLGAFDPAHVTPREVAARAGLVGDGVTLSVEDAPFALAGACEGDACPARGRFLPEYADAPACEACGGLARPHPFDRHDDQIALAELPQRSFADLGLAAGGALVLRDADAGAFARLVPAGAGEEIR